MAPTGHHDKDLFVQWLCQKELLAILMDPLNNPLACQLIKPLLPKPLGTQKLLLPRNGEHAMLGLWAYF